MPRLLVVDDEESICFSMKEYFTLQGYRVDTAQDREEAEQLVEATEYDVIIEDLRLGSAQKPDGLEMIKFIRGHNAHARIVVLTGSGSHEMEKEARANGADAFLSKPKPLSHVAQVIQGLIEPPRSRLSEALDLLHAVARPGVSPRLPNDGAQRRPWRPSAGQLNRSFWTDEVGSGPASCV